MPTPKAILHQGYGESPSQGVASFMKAIADTRESRRRAEERAAMGREVVPLAEVDSDSDAIPRLDRSEFSDAAVGPDVSVPGPSEWGANDEDVDCELDRSHEELRHVKSAIEQSRAEHIALTEKIAALKNVQSIYERKKKKKKSLRSILILL